MASIRLRCARSWASWLCCSSPASAYAQYTANIQGVVEDPSAAGIASAKIELLNLATQVSATTTADALGQLPVPEPRARLVQDHGRGAGVQARRDRP